MATLSQERAGLIAPPANLASRPPVEQMYRMLTAFGDQVEQQFAGIMRRASIQRRTPTARGQRRLGDALSVEWMQERRDPEKATGP